MAGLGYIHLQSGLSAPRNRGLASNMAAVVMATSRRGHVVVLTNVPPRKDFRVEACGVEGLGTWAGKGDVYK